MAHGFRPMGGAYVAELDEAESRLVAQLARDVLQMLNTRAELTGDLLPEEEQGADLPDDAVPGSGAPDTDAAASAPAPAGAAQDADAASDTWWEELGLTVADLGVGPDGTLVPDNAADTETSAGAPKATTRRRARPSDPAVARLLPDLVAPGDAAEGEAERLRALTEPGILATKRANLTEAADLLSYDPLRISSEAAPRFASALNDIRLVLAERLGIQSEEDAERVANAEDETEDELERYMALLYGFVSWLQESLMTALLRRKH